jgi:hypothetical protein
MRFGLRSALAVGACVVGACVTDDVPGASRVPNANDSGVGDGAGGGDASDADTRQISATFAYWKLAKATQGFRVVNVAKIGGAFVVAANFKQDGLALPLATNLNAGEAPTTPIEGAPSAPDNGLLALYDADAKLVSGHTLYTEIDPPSAPISSPGYGQVLDLIEAGSDTVLALVSAGRMNQGQIADTAGPLTPTPPTLLMRTLDKSSISQRIPTLHKGTPYGSSGLRFSPTSDNLFVFEGKRSQSALTWTLKHTLVQRGTRNSADQELSGFRLGRTEQAGTERIYLAGQTACEADVLLDGNDTPVLSFPNGFKRDPTGVVAPQCVFIVNLSSGRQELVVSGSGFTRSFNGWSLPRSESEKLQLSVRFDNRLPSYAFFSELPDRLPLALPSSPAWQVYRVDRDISSNTQSNVLDVKASKLLVTSVQQLAGASFGRYGLTTASRVVVNSLTLAKSESSTEILAGGTQVEISGGEERGVLIQENASAAAVTSLAAQGEPCAMQAIVGTEESISASAACFGGAVLRNDTTSIALGAEVDNQLMLDLARNGRPNWVYNVAGDGRLPLGRTVNALHNVALDLWMTGELAAKQRIRAGLIVHNGMALPDAKPIALAPVPGDAGPLASRFAYVVRIQR